MESKKEERRAAIDRLIKKTELIAKNCKSLTYDLMFCDTHGDELTRMTDCNRDMSKDDKIELLKESIESSLEMYPKTYSVVGFVGPISPKTARIDIKEVIGYDLVETEDDSIIMPVPPTVKQQSQRQQTMYEEPSNQDDFFAMLNSTFNGDPNGLGSLDVKTDPKTQFAMNLQSFRLNTTHKIEQLNGVIDNDKTIIAELKAKLQVLEQKCEKLEKDCDRQKKYIETMRPKVEEANKLKTKQGQLGALAGTVLSQVAITMLGSSKYGALLGFGQEGEPEQDQQIPQQQPQQVEMESEQNYDVEQVTEE